MVGLRATGPEIPLFGVSPARTGQKHHPEARMGLIRLILTKIHPPERFRLSHGGPQGMEGSKIGFFTFSI